MKASDFLPSRATGDQMALIANVNEKFYKLALFLEEEIPSSANRTAALRSMLEAKMTLVQGITHPDA